MKTLRTYLFIVSAIFFCGIAACSNNSTGPKEEEPEPKLTEEQAIDVVIKFLKDNDLEPASNVSNNKTAKAEDPGLMDYISYEQDGENGKITLYLGTDGYLIPGPEWQKNNPDACKSNFRYMRNSVKWVTIEIFPSAREVHISVIEVETGKIIAKTEGTGSGSSWIYDAILDAWSKFDLPPAEKAVGPCGERIDLKIEFSSVLVIEVPRPFKLDVEGEINLTLNEDENYYSGSGTLHWNSLDLMGNYSDSDVTCVPGTLKDEPIEVVNLILPGMATANNKTELKLWLNPDGSNMSTIRCTANGVTGESNFIKFSTMWIAAHLDNQVTGKKAILLENWDEVGDFSGAIAQKIYDRTVTVPLPEDGTFTIDENTVIKIVHNLPVN